MPSWLVVLGVVGLAGCANEPDQEGSSEAAQATAAPGAAPGDARPVAADARESAPEPEEHAPLDLSLPEDFDFGGLEPREVKPERGFDTGALFDQSDDSALDVVVLPEVTIDEGAGAIPRLEGGSVTVKKKTR